MAVCWILENNYNIEYILHLLDDFLTIDRLDSTPERTMAILTLVFRKLGLPLSQKKTVGPTHVLEYLGIILDSIRMEARLPTEKVSRITEFIEVFLKRKSCTKRELLSLLGHLNYACKVIYPGRAFVSYLIRLSCSVKELHHHIKLSNECCLDLQMWHMFLQTWNGVSFFLDYKETTADELRFYTHATSNTFSAFYNGKWFYGNFEELCSISVEKDDMCRFELYPIVMAAALWGSEWCRKRIIVNCINATKTEIINRHRCKSHLTMKFVRKLVWLQAKHNFVIRARWKPDDIINIICDSICQFQIDRFRCLVPRADNRPTECLPVSALMQI